MIFYTCMTYNGNQYPFLLHDDMSHTPKMILKFDSNFVEHHPVAWPQKSFDDTLNRIREYHAERKMENYAILQCELIPYTVPAIMVDIAHGLIGDRPLGFEIWVNEVFDYKMR